MINSTLCYLSRGDEYLLLHRVKKKNDLNHDKWIGPGGKLEEGESPEDCILREMREETGLTLTSFRYRGIVTFVSDRWENEFMHLFSADGFTGELTDCDEGVPEWIAKKDFASLPQWEGDRIFLRLLEQGAPFFSLKLRYEGETLVEAVLDGRDILHEAPARPKIYFCGSIRGGRQDADVYRRMIDRLKARGTVLTEHVGSPSLTDRGGDGTNEEIWLRDTAWLRECDIVVAECSQPSLGVGYELAFAEALGKPVHVFYGRDDGRLSAMLSGNPGFFIHEYRGEAELMRLLDALPIRPLNPALPAPIDE